MHTEISERTARSQGLRRILVESIQFGVAAGHSPRVTTVVAADTEASQPKHRERLHTDRTSLLDDTHSGRDGEIGGLGLERDQL
jgi:hypothetical protein